MVKYTALAALAASSAFAAPAQKRQDVSPPGITDAIILNYALTLEHLENTFYHEALSNYTEAAFAAQGFDSTVYSNIKRVSGDEQTHVDFLTAGLKAAGATPVAACTYSFPATDPKTFLATASILEGVGVSAYLGAAADIMNKTYLTDAGSILTVESRHSAYIRNALGESPYPSPFDVPLDFDEVYTLASQFIVSCPASNPKLPVKAFPALTMDPSTAMPIKPGDEVTVDAAKPVTGNVYAAFVTALGPVFTDIKSADNGAGMKFTVQVPSDVKKYVLGQSYLVLTSSCDGVSDDNALAGPAAIEVTGSD